MQLTFAYGMILFAYVCFGGVALAIAVILAIAPGTRRLARRLAGGVIGSYPGVFLFQILVVPLLAAVWGACWIVNRVTSTCCLRLWLVEKHREGKSFVFHMPQKLREKLAGKSAA